MGEVSLDAKSIEEWMVSRVGKGLNLPPDKIERDLPLLSMGLDSLTLFALTGELAEWLGRDLPVQLVWEYPTIGEMARHLAESSGRRSASIPSVPRDQPIVLSFAQEKIWRSANKGGDGNILLEQWILNGPLNIPALEHGISEMVRRHESLRTTYVEKEGTPVQIIHQPVAVSLPVIDLSAESDPDATAVAILREKSTSLMNLESGPLINVVLLRLSKREHRIIFTLHHLAYDAASLEIFYEELSALYAANCRGEALRLEQVPVQVADFAVWQRTWLRKEGPQFQKLMAWWKQYWSAPMPETPRLPFLRKTGGRTEEAEEKSTLRILVSKAKQAMGIRTKEKPAPLVVEESIFYRDIPGELIGAVKALARREGATEFMVFLAAFELLLHRITGQEEMVIGNYISDRPRQEVAKTVGFFVNMLAIRVDLRGQPSFIELLRRVRDTMQQIAVHQELPFEELLAEFRKEQKAAPEPTVIFQCVRDPALSFNLPGVEVERWRVKSQPLRFGGLTLHLFERADGSIRACITFDNSHYEPLAVEQMLRQYEDVLRDISDGNPCS